MERKELISRMRNRVAMGRRLAKSTSDKRNEILRLMADEAERDVGEIEAEPREIFVMRIRGEGKGESS
jgi:hypothetical protein